MIKVKLKKIPGFPETEKIRLFEFRHDFVHFIIWIAAAAVRIHDFPTITAWASVFVEKRILWSTSAFKLSILQENKPYRHKYEKQSQKGYC